MKVNRKELVATFAVVAPGLSTKDNMNQARSFVFYDGRCWTFNDRTAVSAAMPEGWTLEGAVKASELHRVLSKMEADEVDVSVAEGVFIFASSKTRVEVKSETDAERYHDSIGVPSKWAKLPKNAHKAFKNAAACAGRVVSQPLLTHIHVKGSSVEATDNYRLFVTYLDGKLPEFLIPAVAVADLVSLDCCEVGRTDGWLHFKNQAGLVYSVRTMEGDYPDFSDALEVDGDSFQFPDGLKSALDRCAEVLDGKDETPFVTVNVAKGVFNVMAAGPYATVKERFKTEYTGSLCFRSNPDLLRAALALSNTCTANASRIALGSEADGFRYVLALLATEDAPAEPAADKKPSGKPAPEKGAKSARRKPAEVTPDASESVGW